jgi:hypothetical protein
MQSRVESVAAELAAGGVKFETGKSRIMATRKDVEQGWHAVSNTLMMEGRTELAAEVRQFVKNMSRASTDKELIAQELLARARKPPVRENPTVR